MEKQRHSMPEPQHYWFKRKKYGSGWTPATREGWFVTFLFIAYLIWLVTGIRDNMELEEMLMEYFLPLVVGVLLFIGVVWKTGEPITWQWGEKKRDEQK